MKPHLKEQVSFKYRFGSFVLDPQDTTPLRLLKDGQPCKIQQKQFEVLVCLIRKHGQPISCEELIREVWHQEFFPTDRRRTEHQFGKLHQQVRLLRKVIGKRRIDGQKGFYCLLGEVVEERSRKEPEGAFEDLTFQWIINAPETRRIELFFGVLICLSILYLLAFWAHFEVPFLLLQQYDPRFISSIFQFIALSFAFKISLSVFKQHERIFPQSPSKDRVMMEACGYTESVQWAEAKESAKDSLTRYLFYWRLFLATWMLTYLIVIGKYVHLPKYALDLLEMAESLFSNFNTLAIALCFVVLDQPTIFRTDGSATDLARTSRHLLKYGTLAIMLIAFVQGALMLLELTNRLSPDIVKNTLWGLEVTTAFVGGVALALYVGRIQSKFLGPSTWLPIVLYVYVALPTLYVASSYGDNRFRTALIIEAALILKCLLFSYVIWLFKSGRLLFYFVRVKKIYGRVNPDWKTFFLNLDRRTNS